ncbi:MAG: HAD family hydrolase [Acidobacteriaceae bacterium]|nr:HAD family hydrolase [Acidobacteriaceae bacterium]
MSNTLYEKLAWLPEPPAGFSNQCRALPAGGSSHPQGDALRALAGSALDLNQLHRLAKTIERLRGAGVSLAPLTPIKLAILSNSTVDFVVPALIASAARHGIALECVKPEFDQVMQEALSPASHVNRAKPDAVLLALDHRAFPLRCAYGDREAEEQALRDAAEHLRAIREGIRAHSGAVSIVQTVAPQPEWLFGSLDPLVPGAPRRLIARFNTALVESLYGTPDLLFDVAGLAATVGLAEWHSPVQWNLAKLPFSDAFLPLYADHVARILAAVRGKSRRCLVLDLDNTVWGGVIGDDGIEGIQCAQGDATGEAFLAVQRLALDLRQRGIVLAVSSKNEDAVARLPFQQHPEMLLKEEHIAVFQANWSDKATNIKSIAEALSLGLESVVLLDDNPAEREFVRGVLPQVAVPELPEDPALYARTLSAAGYFEAVALSAEDLQRAGFYQDNARRVELLKQASDVNAYLASLNMEITFQPFDATGRARITQLINKSNQFNLTTRRYTEAEVAEAERDCFTLQVRLADRFGDNGMISVVICRTKPYATWEIDTWLMSCRVLGRGVEQMVLREMVRHARRDQIRTLIGVYLPTDRNQLVKDHYAKLGFTSKSEQDGATIWELDVETAAIEAAPMTVRSFGFDAIEAQRALLRDARQQGNALTPGAERSQPSPFCAVPE